MCTGILITPRFILTPAQCVKHVQWASIGSLYQVGDDDLANCIEIIDLKCPSKHEPPKLSFDPPDIGTPTMVQSFSIVISTSNDPQTLIDSKGAIEANTDCDRAFNKSKG
ncbi:hypothetical protein AC1031_004451 [Aphanomyces cochlioides]|nr:hypothetical protein AC1031_004451 [Aphanomyces cochlioides]